MTQVSEVAETVEVAEARGGMSRASFIRNAAKGSVMLVAGGGVLASMEGVAFAKTTKTDITVLQTGYIAETLAVTVYGAILKTYYAKLKLDPGNRSYFEAAYRDEVAHRDAWAAALGKKYTPTGFKLTVPGKYVASKNALASTGVALEEAFVATYMGAVKEFNSADLRVTAAGVAANEATHYSFFDAILPNGNAVLPAFGPKAITAGQAAATLTKLGFLV
ncbi:MAG: ferritin-like domain-containing protein [Actinomycetota bacterium]|nr:ferritin-like domain-containing protein [Actinomycetota bacterium]